MKHYKIKLTFICIFFIFLGCNNETQKRETLEGKINSEYYNLIYSIAFGQADLLCNTCETEQHYEEVKKKLKTYERKIEDDTLDILMKLHRLEYYFDENGPYKEALDENGGTFPIKICYIESRYSDFKYVFALNDEYYYHLLYNDTFTTSNQRLRETLKYKIVFENQLNYVINELGINKKEKKVYLKRFINKFFTELLEREKITNKFNINRLLGLESSIKSDTCSKNIETNIAQVFNDIKHNDNVQYFNCFDGIRAFWKVEIIENDSILKLKIVLHNAECYDILSI